MKLFYLLLFIFIPFTVLSQSGKKSTSTDSAAYYLAQLDSLWRAHMDSLYNSETYKELLNKYESHKRENDVKYGKDYGGFSLFMDIVRSDYRHFNNLLAQDGFPPLHDVSYRFGFGSSTKAGHLILDFYLVVGGMKNSTSKANEEVATGFSSFLQFDIGYDLLNANRFSLYPYAGIGCRSSSIWYTRPGQLNPDYSGLGDMIITDERKIGMESFRVGYQLGLGFDWAVLASKKSRAETILFVKAGINNPFWRDTYRIHEDIPKYKPGIKHGAYIITVGVKFVARQ